MVKIRFVPSALSRKRPWSSEIVRWTRIFKNDVLRLRHFEKDDLLLVISTIRGLRNETPIAAGERSTDD